jgi:hypothetical protein
MAYTRSLFYLATIGYTSCQLVDRNDIATHLTINTHSSSQQHIVTDNKHPVPEVAELHSCHM